MGVRGEESRILGLEEEGQVLYAVVGVVVPCDRRPRSVCNEPTRAEDAVSKMRTTPRDDQ